MKECRYCRTKYDDNFAVCPNCGGTKVVTEQELAEEAALIQRETEYRERVNAVSEMRKRSLIVVLAIAVICVIGGIVTVSYNVNKPLSNGMSKDEGEEILARGMAYFDDGDYESAMECFQQLPSDSKQYEKAQSMLQKSKDSYRSEILNRVDSYIENGEFDSAFNLINQARRMLPEDSDLQVAYDKAYSAYQTSVLEQVESYVASEQYEIALEYLSGVQAQYPNDAVLQDAYNNTLSVYQDVVRSDAMQQADDYMANGDYVQAISVIESAEDKIGQDEVLVAKLNVYGDTYASLVIASAKEQYIEYNADSLYAAEKMISDALNVLPNNQVLVSELDFYREHEPIKIISMPESSVGYTSGQFDIIDSAIDNKGKNYENVIYVEQFAYSAHDDQHNWWLYCYKTIDIDFQYSKITGTLFQNGMYSTASTETKFQILAYEGEEAEGLDNEIVLSSQVVTGDSIPVRFEADVSGRKYIQVEFLGDINSGNEDEAYHYAYVSELYLWK